MNERKLESDVLRPSGFRFGAVPSQPALRAAVEAEAEPNLGPLADFTGTFTGKGFNTIFRPQNPATPTPLPVPDPTSDNILELNLTEETLSFSKSLGSVPNRGMVQGDIFLNGVPYLQVISDVTDPSQPVGIHFEPGLWVIVPSTSNPAQQTTLVRMASIPHGTTIEAQGLSGGKLGAPNIPPVDITPFVTADPTKKIRFDSQTVTNNKTPRIPQDLSTFVTAGAITQAILDDPNTVLRNQIAAQNIISTTTIFVSTDPDNQIFGGGTDNIEFLLGTPAALTNPASAGPNAQALKMTAVFWIEKVEYVIEVPIYKPGQPPLEIEPKASAAGQLVPKFLVTPPAEIKQPREIKVIATQIQYSQQVFLNFNKLTWPHVSVATLVSNEPIPVPPSAWQ